MRTSKLGSAIPAESYKKDKDAALLTKTSHSDSGGQRSKKVDPLAGKAKTSHEPRSLEDDVSIMNYQVDEWATDDEAGPIVKGQHDPGSSALEKLKSKSKKKKKATKKATRNFSA